MTASYRVSVVDPDRLSLAGHMAASLLRRSCTDERNAARAARVRGDVAVNAGGMRLCLEFARDEVRVRAGDSAKPRASIVAPLDVLLDTALGRGVVGNFLRGKVKARGNPAVLWRIMKLMRV